MAESPSRKRSDFFSGKLLTPEDLGREQQYVREKLKRHNRTLHGFGIVSGLKVRINSGQIIVEPGLALDCEGNELLIETAQSVALPQLLSPSDAPSADPSSADASSSAASPAVNRHAAFLNVRFVADCDVTQCAQAANEVLAPETEQPANASVPVGESFELEVGRENCNRGHRHLRARWLACGQPHALTIAKLRRRTQGWTIDRGYRPPSVK